MTKIQLILKKKRKIKQKKIKSSVLEKNPQKKIIPLKD